ncbi:MAG TPA: hypothetical protein VL117_03780 [Thermoleophilia bacterium]|nr:hypothetical protein [Thermoleophilia bacterium]
MTNDTDSRPIAPATAPIAPATAPIAPATAPIAGPPPPARVRVVVGAGVSDFVNARGGRLYVWATLHRCCTGGLTLLDAGVEPPARRRSHFTPLDADGFELSFDGGVHGLPETLVLELTRGKRKVRAYWNDCAFVS